MTETPIERLHLQPLGALRKRQSQLRDLIRDSDQELFVHSDAEKRKTLALLQREYNHLVDEAIKLRPPLYPDPLERLPFELWISIIDCLLDNFDTFHREPYAVNQLLNLTGVSKTWSAALLSVPSFWTTVVLDSNDDDCLAKAATSMQLSGTLELDVQISVPLYAWKNMAAIIASHGERIRTLTLPDKRKFLWQPFDISNILASFGRLPALRHLHVVLRLFGGLPVSSWPPLGNTVETLALDRFPSLQMITGLRLKPEVVTSVPRSIKSIEIDDLDGTLIKKTLLQFPDLQHLDLYSPLVIGNDVTLDHTEQESSHALRLPLSSIAIAIYDISDLNSILMLTGQDLREIHIKQDGNTGFFDILMSLQQFQVTHIRIDLTWHSMAYDTHADIAASCHFPTVKFLELRFDGETDDRSEQWIDAIFRTLVGAMPLVESFVLRGDVALSLSLQYVQTLSKLRSLVLQCNRDTPLGSSCLFVGQLLDNLAWSGNLPTKFFDQLQCPSLLTLSFAGHLMKHEKEFRTSQRSTQFSFPMLEWEIPVAATPSVTSLSLTMLHPIRVKLASFPAVTQVCLTHSTWISDFFEELLLRPNECPKLENIIVEGSYLEWDVLLLMLERRNFATKSGVASIKSIRFASELPFKLLHAISDLLRGKYLGDIQIIEFSIGAVSKRMCTQSQTGCLRCCEFLRECDSPAKGVWSPWDYEQFGWRYPLPSMLTNPEPILSPGLAHWMSGKMTRRVAFARKALLAENSFNRLDDCGRGAQSSRRVITAFSMEFD